MSNNVNIQITANAKQAQAEMAKLSGNLERLTGAFKRLGHYGAAALALPSLAGVGRAAVQAGTDVVRLADAMTLLDARMKLAVGAAGDFVAAKGRLIGIAQAVQAPLAETVTLFTRLSTALRDAGGNQAHALGITQAMTDALSISGASSAEAASAMLQFSQSMASGVMRGEEFNAVNEAAPRVMRAIADELGVASGALRQMSQDGKLTADVIGNALLARMGELRSEAAQIPGTVGGAMQNLRTNFSLLVGDANNATEGTRFLAEAINLLARNLATLVDLAVIGAKQLFAYAAATAAVTAATTLAVPALTLLRNTMLGLSLLWNVGGIKAIATGILGVGGAAKTAAISVGTLASALRGAVLVWAAFDLGKWAFQNFLPVRLFTVSVVRSFQIMWEKIRHGAALTGAAIKSALTIGGPSFEQRRAPLDAAHRRALKAIESEADANADAFIFEHQYNERQDRGDVGAKLAGNGAGASDKNAAEAKAAATRAAEADAALLQTGLARVEALRAQSLTGERQYIEQKRMYALAEVEIAERKPQEILRTATDQSARADARVELAKLAEQRLQIDIRAGAERADVERRSQSEITKIHVEALRARGQLAQAYRDEFFSENAAKLAELQADGAAGMAEFQALMQKYSAGYGNAQREEVIGLLDQAGARLDAVRQRLDAEVTIGTKSRTQAQIELREETARLGQGMARDLLPRLQELIELAPDDATREKWRAMAAEIQAMQAAGRDVGFLGGLRQGLEDFALSASDVFGGVKEAVGRAFSGMTEALTSFVMTGKLGVKDLVDSILRDLLRIQIQKSIVGPLSQVLGAVVGSFGGGAGGAKGGGIPFSLSRALPSALGNVFQSPSLHQYVNQIHNSPQHFTFDQGPQKFARGGVFAEAGPEAIMPLARDGAGRLGVRAQGGGGGDVKINIHNYAGAPVTTQRDSTDSRGTRQIDLMIGEAAAAQMRRPGSALNTAARSGFGLQPAMISR